MFILTPDQLEQFLEDNGFEIVNKTTKEIQCLCLWHQDKNTSFSISKKTGKWKCFAGCGAGGFDVLVKRLNTQVVVDLKNQILKLVELKQEEKTIEEDPVVPIQFPKQFKLLTKSAPKSFLSYIDNRLKRETVEFFSLYYCDEGYYHDRIIIPIFQNKVIMSFLGRHIGGSDKRYLNAYNSQLSNFLFNYDNVKKNEKIILCESCFDCMSAVEKNYVSSVSTFGTNISTKQKDLLASLSPSEIIVAFHNDPAGTTEFYKNLSYLKTLAPVSRIYLPRIFDTQKNTWTSLDINECTKEQFDVCYSAKKEMTSVSKWIKEEILRKIAVA